MSENRLLQKQDELTRFKATALYEDLMASIQLHRRKLTVSLLTAALRSHDPKVRAIAEAVRVDSTFERELGMIELPNNVKKTMDPKEEEMEYRNYNQLLDLDFEPDQEY